MGTRTRIRPEKLVYSESGVGMSQRSWAVVSLQQLESLFPSLHFSFNGLYGRRRPARIVIEVSASFPMWNCNTVINSGIVPIP